MQTESILTILSELIQNSKREGQSRSLKKAYDEIEEYHQEELAETYPDPANEILGLAVSKGQKAAAVKRYRDHLISMGLRISVKSSMLVLDYHAKKKLGASIHHSPHSNFSGIGEKGEF